MTQSVGFQSVEPLRAIESEAFQSAEPLRAAQSDGIQSAEPLLATEVDMDPPASSPSAPSGLPINARGPFQRGALTQ
ncbi:MAG: hypothetical protein WCI05_10485 [Myxococcales bacterium]